LIIVLFFLAGCGNGTPQTTPTAPTEGTVVIPTSTQVPMALKVNGQGITLVEYQAELLRLQKAQQVTGETTSEQEQKDRILNNYIDQLLLSQAATQNGQVVEDAALQARIDKLATDIGGVDKLTEWQSNNGYTPEAFKEDLRRAILVAWQRDQIIDSVTQTAEQIHARQILLQDEVNANAVYAQLQAGSDFLTLAKLYEPVLGGDLGWFPVGGLTQPNVAEAAFAIQPGEYTQVIKSEIGYHIVFVIERETDHALSIDARRVLQEIKLKEWLDASRKASTIEILVP
jgi:peptidyl-prolyl cis-trans isomerase C